MLSLLLERFTLALLPHVRMWDGWKVRIPVNTIGLSGAVRSWTATHNMRTDIEVGMIGKHKVNLTLLVDPPLNRLQTAILGSAKDGTFAVLAPVVWIQDAASVKTPDEYRWDHPTMLVLPERYAIRLGYKTVAWFVWSRENHPTWKVLEA